MESTLENPLAFFDYYFDNGINKDVADYDQAMKTVDNHISELSSEKTPLEYRYSSEPSSYTMSLEEWINSAIKNEVKLSKRFIEQGFEKRFSDKKDVKAYAVFLKLKFNDLKNYKAFNKYSFLSSTIGEFLGVVNRYSKEIIKINTEYSFFDCQELKPKFFVELYELTYNLDLIDDSEIDEDDFIDIFTSSKPQDLGKKIQFKKENTIVIHYFESLKIFFGNLSANSIEKSQAFLTKQNSILTETIYNTTKSRGQNKKEAFKSKIDAGISKLKSKHLK